MLYSLDLWWHYAAGDFVWISQSHTLALGSQARVVCLGWLGLVHSEPELFNATMLLVLFLMGDQDFQES